MDRGRDGDGERTDESLVRANDVDDGGTLLAALAAAPLTIADGHHRYETAPRYREDRGRIRACESDPAWDYVLALIYPAGGSPPALPTHRILLDGPTGDALLDAFGDLVTIERLGSAEELLARMTESPSIPPDVSGSGRIGLVSDSTAAILHPRAEAIGGRLDPTSGTPAVGST